MDQHQAFYAQGALRTACEVLPQAPWRAKARWVAAASFTYLIINLNDALQVLRLAGRPVTFRDDADPPGSVTDLIARVRNAVCHTGSLTKRVNGMVDLTFCSAEGRGCLAEIGGVRLENPYDDDIAFFYGAHRVLLRRHLLAAADVAKQQLTQAAAAAGLHLHRWD